MTTVALGGRTGSAGWHLLGETGVTIGLGVRGVDGFRTSGSKSTEGWLVAMESSKFRGSCERLLRMGRPDT
jgi:hypothetical protein